MCKWGWYDIASVSWGKKWNEGKIWKMMFIALGWQISHSISWMKFRFLWCWKSKKGLSGVAMNRKILSNEKIVLSLEFQIIWWLHLPGKRNVGGNGWCKLMVKLLDKKVKTLGYLRWLKDSHQSLENSGKHFKMYFSDKTFFVFNLWLFFSSFSTPQNLSDFH